MKYHHRISVLVDCHFKRLIGILIAADAGRNWYEWQLRQIFRDFAMPEDERQDLLDQINLNYKRWLSVGCCQ